MGRELFLDPLDLGLELLGLTCPLVAPELAGVTQDALQFQPKAAGASSLVLQHLIDILLEVVQAFLLLYAQQLLAIVTLAAVGDHHVQAALLDSGLVGKTNALPDVVKVVNRELRGGTDADYRIPESASAVAQTLLQYQSSHRPQDLWHMVTPDYTATAIWIQLASGDNHPIHYDRHYCQAQGHREWQDPRFR